MITVVALSGFKGSGKDTVANYLVEKRGFKRVAFADPLKKMVSESFSIPRYYLDNPEFKESPLSQYPVPATDEFTTMVSNFMVREFRTKSGFTPDVRYLRSQDGILQTFFNEWENLYHTPRSLAILMGSTMRSASSNFWVLKAVEMIKTLSNNYEGFVISDLRYRSEIDQLKQYFGEKLVTVRINRFDSSPSTDPSEVDLVGTKHDFEIINKGTLEQLFTNTENALASIWQIGQETG